MFVLSVCSEGILKLWTVDRNELRRRCAMKEEESDLTWLINNNDDGTNDKNNNSRDETMMLIDAAVKSVVAHEEEVHSLTVSPNDKFAATSSSDKTVKIWSLPDLEFLGVCKGHKRAVWAVKFSPVEQVKFSNKNNFVQSLLLLLQVFFCFI